MSQTPEKMPLRQLTVMPTNWFPVSFDVGRDEALCAIEDEALILSALGLMVAGTALCLAKDDDWISRNEVFRILIPGTKEGKLEAATALCSVRLWVEEERDGVAGWRLGVADVLDGKRARHLKGKRGAAARYNKNTPPPEGPMPPTIPGYDEETPF
jgi:hypothetical protein